MDIDSFLPTIEFHSSILTKFWNLTTTKIKDKGLLAGYVDGQTIKYRDGPPDKKLQRIETKFAIKPQSDSQISKDQLQKMCQELKNSLSNFRKSKLLGKEEHQEISECSSNNVSLDEKTQNPDIQDFIKLDYIFYPDQSTKKLFWKAFAIIPDIKLSLCPIKGFGLAKIPMTIKLLQKKALCRTGFLTLDQEKRLIPLHPSDPQVNVFPLVGIWATGEGNMQQDPLVYAAMLRFLFSEQIKSRVSPNGQSSLLLYFPHSQELPQFYEFQFSGQNNSWKLIESLNEVTGENNKKPIKVAIQCHKLKNPTSGLYSIKKFPILFQSKNTKENVEPNTLSRNAVVTNNHSNTKEVQTKAIKKIIMNVGAMTTRGNSETRLANIHDSRDSEVSPGMDGVEEGVKGSKPYISRQKDGLISHPTSCRTSFKNYHFAKENRLETEYPSVSENASLIRTPDYSIQTSPNSEKSSVILHKIIMEQQKQIQSMQQQLMLYTQELDTIKHVDSRSNRSSFASLTSFGNRADTSAERCLTQRNSIDRSQASGLDNNLTLPSSRVIQLSAKNIKFTKASKPLGSLVNIERLSPELGVINTQISNSTENKSCAKKVLVVPQKKSEPIEKKQNFIFRMDTQPKVICNKIPPPVILNDSDGFLKDLQDDGASKSLDNQPSTDTSAKDALSAIKETNESIYSPDQESNKKKNAAVSRQKNNKVRNKIKLFKNRMGHQ